MSRTELIAITIGILLILFALPAACEGGAFDDACLRRPDAEQCR